MNPRAGAAALTVLPGMGPRRLLALLRAHPDPADAWSAVVHGRVAAAVEPKTIDDWRRHASRVDPDAVLESCRTAGVDVLVLGDERFPPLLAVDPEPPAVLFVRGELDALDGPRVAIVGTRRCTYGGRSTARELGAALAESGVRVVSGLAAGIDGAAHEGALGAHAAPPVGVVGSGLDVVYPASHTRLWRAVATAGVLLSEAPPGAAPERWRFPARNRILAALADVVVVVESHARGGSQHTVDAALERDVPVMAVPGSVRSPASAGTNQLLADGAPPVRDVDDVLVALGLAPARRPPSPSLPGLDLDPDTRAVLDALGPDPSTVDSVAIRSGRPIPVVTRALHVLDASGAAVAHSGWWSRVR